MRHLLAAVVALVIGALTALAVAGSSRLDGPVLWVLSDRHGLHEGDLVVLGVAAVGLLTLAGLHRAGRGRRGSAARGGRERLPETAGGSERVNGSALR